MKVRDKSGREYVMLVYKHLIAGGKVEKRGTKGDEEKQYLGVQQVGGYPNSKIDKMYKQG